MSNAIIALAADASPYGNSRTTRDVQTTIEPIRTDGPAEDTSAPQWNEFQTDDSPQLKGLATRQLSGDVHESVQYPAWWIPGAEYEHNVLIDSQVASSGTAAARESAGIAGHGTAEFTESIEPVIRDGAAYGNDYFSVNAKDVQEGSGAYMTSAIPDVAWQGVAQSLGTRGAQAARSGLYDNFIGA